MRKIGIVILSLTLLLIFPIESRALDYNINKTHKINISNYTNLGFRSLAKDKNKNTKKNSDDVDVDDIEDIIDDYNQDQSCDGSDSLLGNPNDEDSVAWLLQQVLNYIKILGPILVVILSSIEFGKVIVQSDDEAMAKAQKKLIIRLILAGCLFFIPTLVTALLQIFGITSDPTCGLE